MTYFQLEEKISILKATLGLYSRKVGHRIFKITRSMEYNYATYIVVGNWEEVH